MRLNTLLQSLPQLHDEGMLMRLYVRHEREDPGLKSQLPFWREAIDRLYREVFMRIDIPRYLIKQAFVIYGQVPASLDNIIDELLSQGNLIRRDEALRNIKSKSWIQQAKHYIKITAFPKSKSNSPDDRLINLKFLEFTKQQLIDWISQSSQGVMEYESFKSYINQSLDGDHQNFHILKEFLKQTDCYDSHLCQIGDEKVKLVKIGKECKLNKLDINLFRLKLKLRKFKAYIQEQSVLKDKILGYLFNKKNVQDAESGQIIQVDLSDNELIYLIEKLGILDKVITKLNHFKDQYLDTNVNQILQLQKSNNQLSANMLATTLFNCLENDMPKFEKINCILDQFDRLHDRQEIQILERYGVYLSESEKDQAIQFYMGELNRYRINQ
eukprot:403331376